MVSGGTAAAVDNGCGRRRRRQWQVRPAAAARAAKEGRQWYDPAIMALPLREVRPASVAAATSGDGGCGRLRQHQKQGVTATVP